MKNIILSLCILVQSIGCLYAEDELEVVRRVMTHLMEGHRNELFRESDGTCRIGSYYQEWRYVNGVLAQAVIDLYRLTGDRTYYRFVADNYAFFFDPDNQRALRADYDKGLRNTGYYRFFRMGSLDDCGAMGAGLVELNAHEKRNEYALYIDRIADYILYRQERLASGVYCRGQKGNQTVWLDDLYMSLSFLTHYGKVYHHDESIECAARQVVLFDSLLYAPTTGLYYHVYYAGYEQPGVAHWGRANGWCLWAQTLLMDVLPKSHPMYNRLLALYRRSVSSIARYQDRDGMWHQLLDKPDSYPETSCTAMFIYAIAKGVNEGWLESGFASVARQAWQTLATTYITEQGELKNVCMGTGIAHDLSFYYERLAPLNDAHGLGAVVQAGMEMHRLNSQNSNEK